MSIDEKYSTIGRIVSERIEARKQLSLLRSKLKTFTRDLSQLLKVLDSNDYQNGIKTLDEINDAGGLAAVRTNLERCISASSHLAELSQEAKDAGIDSNDSI